MNIVIIFIGIIISCGTILTDSTAKNALSYIIISQSAFIKTSTTNATTIQARTNLIINSLFVNSPSFLYNINP